MTKTNPIHRFYKYAYTRPWAWTIVRYLIVPLASAWIIVSEHLPEVVSEIRDGWADLEAERLADLAASQAPPTAPHSPAGTYGSP